MPADEEDFGNTNDDVEQVIEGEEEALGEQREDGNLQGVGGDGDGAGDSDATGGEGDMEQLHGRSCIAGDARGARPALWQQLNTEEIINRQCEEATASASLRKVKARQELCGIRHGASFSLSSWRTWRLSWRLGGKAFLFVGFHADSTNILAAAARPRETSGRRGMRILTASAAGSRFSTVSVEPGMRPWRSMNCRNAGD